MKLLVTYVNQEARSMLNIETEANRVQVAFSASEKLEDNPTGCDHIAILQAAGKIGTHGCGRPELPVSECTTT